MGRKIKIPVTGTTSEIVEVPEQGHVANIQGLFNSLHGAGLFPVYKNINGKVIVTTGLNVKVLDWLGSIQDSISGGVVLSYYKGKRKLESDKFVTLDLTSLVGADPGYIIVENIGKIKFMDDDDNEDDRCEHKRGTVRTVTTLPENSEYILLAKTNIPGGTTVLTQTMIDETCKDFLYDIEKSLGDLRSYVDTSVARAKREIYDFILGEYTTSIRTEIADGDSAVLTELNNKCAAIQVQIDNLDISIVDIRASLDTLKTYVDEKVALLESQTDALAIALSDLSNAVEENALFIQQVNDNVSAMEGDIVSIQNELVSQLTQIEDMQAQLAITESTFGVQNAINIAKTNFKVDAYHEASGNDLYKGWVDTFMDLSKVDIASSSGSIGIAGQKLVIIPGSEAVLRYEFEDIPTAVPDTTGNQDGAIYGSVSKVAGIVGDAVHSNASGAVDIPYNTAIMGSPDALTLEHWTKVIGSASSYFMPWGSDRGSATANKQGRLCAFGMLHSHPYGVWCPSVNLVVPGEIGFVRLGIDVAWIKALSATKPKLLIDQDWHHFATVIDGGFKFYIDGELMFIVDTADSVKFYAAKYKGDGTASVLYNGSLAGMKPYDPVAIYGPVGLPLLSTYMRYLTKNSMDECRIYKSALSDADVLKRYNKQEIGEALSLPIGVVTKATDIGSVPANALLTIDDSGDITYQVSRDDGTTWTTITPNVKLDISGQPSGQLVRVKASLPAETSFIDNLAVFAG